jgi:hypothetical protein
MRVYWSIKWHEFAAAPPYVSKIFHKAFFYLRPPFVPSLTEVMPYYVTLTVTEVDVTAANKGKENSKYHPLRLYYAASYYLQIFTCTTRTAHQDIGACMFSNQKYTLGFFLYTEASISNSNNNATY